VGGRHASERLPAAGSYSDVSGARFQAAPYLGELEVGPERLMRSGDAITTVALQAVCCLSPLTRFLGLFSGRFVAIGILIALCHSLSI